jgi:hypothetical protein
LRYEAGVDIDERFPAWAPGAESRTRALPSVRAGDYEAIEAAVMETSRGRWFLREFAKRNRAADTRLLLKALGQLERALETDRATRDLDGLRAGLSAMAGAIASARSDNAAPHERDRREGDSVRRCRPLRRARPRRRGDPRGLRAPRPHG